MCTYTRIYVRLHVVHVRVISHIYTCVVYVQLQDMWKDFVRETYACCCPQFWSVYETVCTQSATCGDKVLHAVKQLVTVTGRWPQSNRTLRKLITKHAGDFWSNVVYKKRIDLSAYNLPGCTTFTFSYVDPVFMWIQRCNALCEAGIPVHWDPKVLHHPSTDEEVYGAGIEYSLLMRNATAEIPVNGKIALFKVSWDGGEVGYGHRSAVPIVLEVMNTNSGSTLAVGVLGYLPYIEIAEGYKKNPSFIKAKRFVLQVMHIMSTCYYARIHVIMHVYKHCVHV